MRNDARISGLNVDWHTYSAGHFYDELMASQGTPRHATQQLAAHLAALSGSELIERKLSAELAIKALGISFTVYSDAGNIDRQWPFDIIPRIISQAEWEKTERGLIQRITALNCFINDVYNDQKIIKDRIIPAELIIHSVNYRSQCVGMKPVFGVWAHICGSDLIRDGEGTVFVLEDNLRVPSGVSYMLENRNLTKRTFPELFQYHRILSVTDYPHHLYELLASLSPRHDERPEIVLLTPGIYNSAYFEHAYLAQQMGIEVVEGNDLFVSDDDCVYKRSIDGMTRVDVIYRRIDDAFLDPDVFDPTSLLGVRGLMRAWRKGHVAVVNAPGAGVADDKIIYTYVPDMIRYYLGEEPILPNVPSYVCVDKKQRDYVLANLDKLVVKPANESGGYGMIIGPHSTKKERDLFAQQINANPRNYMAQPLISLSTAPVLTQHSAEPRHIDLRPFVLQGHKHYVTPGGLTRVAMRKGSYVVNSSQGGGSKDTWIVVGE